MYLYMRIRKPKPLSPSKITRTWSAAANTIISRSWIAPGELLGNTALLCYCFFKPYTVYSCCRNEVTLTSKFLTNIPKLTHDSMYHLYWPRTFDWLFNLRILNSKLIRWRLKPEEFNYTVMHKHKCGCTFSNRTRCDRNRVIDEHT